MKSEEKLNDEVFKKYLELEEKLHRIRYLMNNMIFSMLMASFLLLLSNIFNFSKVAQVEYIIFYLLILAMFVFTIATLSLIIFKRYSKIRKEFYEISKKIPNYDLVEEYKKSKKIHGG